MRFLSRRASHRSLLAVFALMLLPAGGFAQTVLQRFYDPPRTPTGGFTELGGYLYTALAQGGPGKVGSIIRVNPASPSYPEPIWTFGPENGVQGLSGSSDWHGDGANPIGPMVARNGFLYGVTTGGSDYGIGYLFKLNPDPNYSGGDRIIAIKVFDWETGMPTAGVAYAGGFFYVPTDNSLILKIDPATGATTFMGLAGYSTLKSALVAFGSDLYGTSSQLPGGYGTVFKINSAGTISTVVTFTGTAGAAPGASPEGDLFVSANDSGSWLYGTTSSGGAYGGGTLYKISSAGAFTSLVSLSTSTGRVPRGGVISSGGYLYGTASAGGTSSRGAIFEFDPASSTITYVKSFTSGYPDSPLRPTAYGLFGSCSSGSIYAYDPVAHTVSTAMSFGSSQPWDVSGAIVSNGSAIFGTSSRGGTSDRGTVYKVDLATGAMTYASFTSTTGGPPMSGLTASGSYFYAASDSSGGALLQIDPATLAITKLAPLGSSGCYGLCPVSPLLAFGGALYGTAESGGGGNGRIFKVTFGPPITVADLATFSGTNGAVPRGPLVASGGFLYGTTRLGGDYGGGTIFRVDPVTGAIAKLYSFGAVSCAPTGLAMSGAYFYGATSMCGSDYGTLFRFDPATGVLTTAFQFDPAVASPYDSAYLHPYTVYDSGFWPEGPLLPVGSLLYGTTYSGGSWWDGTIFRFDPATNTRTTLFDFMRIYDGTGSLPTAPLISVGSYVYGTTTRGSGGGGTLFSTNVLPRMAAAGPLTRTAGGVATVDVVGTVSDHEDAAGNLTVSVSPSTGFTVTGVTNNGGTISASIGVDASVIKGEHYLYFTVRDSGRGSAGCFVVVNVVSGGSDAPTNFTATATGPTQVTLQWNGVANVTGYEVLRNGTLIAQPTSPGHIDNTASANTSYVYKVRAVSASFQSLYVSDVATTAVFANDPLSAGVAISASHVQQLRGIVNALRVAAGMTAYTFSEDPVSSGMLIRASHLTQLRTALAELRSNLSLSAIAVTDSTLTPNTTLVKAVHVQEIRDGVK